MRIDELRTPLDMLKELKGPDREADKLIALAIDGWKREIDRYGTFWWKPGEYRLPERDDYPPRFTADEHELMLLVERVLPVPPHWVDGSAPSSGWKINIYRGMIPSGQPYASWHAMIRLHAGKEEWFIAPTLCLAVLQALFHALIQWESTKS